MAALKVSTDGVEVLRAFPQVPCIELTTFLDKTVLLVAEIEAGSEVSSTVGACGPVDRALESKAEGLGFDFHCRSCVWGVGQTFHSLLPPMNNRYIVEHEKLSCNNWL